MLLGYARVSTKDQSTTAQEDALKAAGCERIFTDQASGARTARPGLDALLAHARKGDVIVVWKLDRLGRSLKHLIATVEGLQATGRGFRSLSESIDTTTATGRLIFNIFGSLAEFERELIRERIKAGVASARARGLTGGRPLALDPKATKLARKLMADHTRNVNDIARTLGISRSTLYRIARREHEEPPATTPAARPKPAATAAGSTARQPTKAAKSTSQAKTTHQPAKGKKPASKRNP